MAKIEIDFKQVDNILDLCNFLKYILRAEVKILHEEKSGIALVAHMRTSNVFARAMQFTTMTAFVFVNKKVKIFFHENSLIHMFSVSPEDLEKTDAKFTEHSFKTIQSFIDFIQPETVPIEFPEIDIQDFKEIDLEKREKALDKWEEVLEKLIPYGVLLDNQRHVNTGGHYVFQLHLPCKAVPKDIALKNEFGDGEYHENFDLLLSFCSGKKDWNEMYKEALSHLKKLYAFEEMVY